MDYDNYTNQNNIYLPQTSRPSASNLRKRLILSFVGFALLLFGYLLFSYGFIEVEIVNPENGNLSYKINDQHQKYNESSFKKLVKRGSYEVLASQDSNNKVGVIESGGFLSTNKLSLELESQKSREFIGDSPASCFEFIKSRLLSWSCFGNAEGGKVHAPATTQIPSLNKSFSVFGYSGMRLMDFLSSDGQTYALVGVDYDDGSQVALYEFDPVTGVIDSTKSRQINELPGGKNYQASRVDDGYLIYSDDGYELMKFKDIGSEIIRINRPDVKDGLKLYSLQTNQNTIVMVFGHEFTGSEMGGSSFFPSYPKNDKQNSGDGRINNSFDEGMDGGEIVLINGDDQTVIPFKNRAHQIRLCGEKMICMLHESKLTFYELNATKLTKLFQMTGVSQIESSGKHLLVVKDDGVMVMDPLTRQGHYEYMFGGYSFCGIKPLDKSYLVCVNSKQDNRRQSVLRINTEVDTTDYIDQQILELQELQEVKSLSIYKNLIYLSPELGELTFDEKTKMLDHNPETKKRVNESINRKINESGIDLRKYTIINPYDN